MIKMYKKASFVHNGTDLVLSIDEKQDIVFHLMYDDGLIKSMKYTVERQRSPTEPGLDSVKCGVQLLGVYIIL